MKLARHPFARVLVSLLSLAALGSAGVAHAQSALDNILKSKTIKIAIPTDYPPYGSVGTDMQPKGLDIDMARLIAEKLGVKELFREVIITPFCTNCQDSLLPYKLM